MSFLYKILQFYVFYLHIRIFLRNFALRNAETQNVKMLNC